jgi:L-aspartate oxidase
MTRYAGVLRDHDSLVTALEGLEALDPSDPEDQNLKDVSTALVRAALAREESRGTHTRLDFPETSAAFLGRFVFAGAGDPHYVPLPEPAAVR